MELFAPTVLYLAAGSLFLLTAWLLFRPRRVPRRRSPYWPVARRKHLQSHPYCLACGRRTDLEVHHIVPFDVRPELELEPGNLITLCERGCHLTFGHLFSWHSWNPQAREDAEWFRRKVSNRPERKR